MARWLRVISCCFVLLGVKGQDFEITKELPASIPINVPYEIDWVNAEGSVSITVALMAANNPTTIASNISATSFVWTPTAAEVPSPGPWVITATDQGGRNFQPSPFNVTGGAAQSSQQSSIAIALLLTTSSTASISKQSPSTTQTIILPQSALDPANQTTPTFSSLLISTSTSTPSTPQGTLVLESVSSAGTLTAGTKAGIGLGVSFAFLLFSCLIGLFFFRYGKRVARPKTPPVQTPKIPNPELEPALSPQELWSPSGQYILPELDIRQPVELEGTAIKGLVPTKKGTRAELDAKRKSSRASSWLLA